MDITQLNLMADKRKEIEMELEKKAEHACAAMGWSLHYTATTPKGKPIVIFTDERNRWYVNFDGAISEAISEQEALEIANLA